MLWWLVYEEAAVASELCGAGRSSVALGDSVVHVDGLMLLPRAVECGNRRCCLLLQRY